MNVMMRTLCDALLAFLTLFISAVIFTGSTAYATEPGLIIVRRNACMGCHMINRKLVGPSFQQIADKYKGDSKAPEKLALKIRAGSSGVWGAIPMPAHPRMSDADLHTVTAWVLAQSSAK